MLYIGIIAKSAAMKEVHVAIPDSLLMEDRDLRDRTVKVGFVARALAIFRVERVYIFSDPVERMDESESFSSQNYCSTSRPLSI
jgi:Uncharacterized conserved protein, COG2106